MGHLLLPELREELVQILVERASKLSAKSMTTVTGRREAEPRLLHLGETVPGLHQTGIEPLRCRLLTEKREVANDLIVEPAVDLLLAVEQEERIDEQRKIRDE